MERREEDLGLGTLLEEESAVHGGKEPECGNDAERDAEGRIVSVGRGEAVHEPCGIEFVLIVFLFLDDGRNLSFEVCGEPGEGIVFVGDEDRGSPFGVDDAANKRRKRKKTNQNKKILT